MPKKTFYVIRDHFGDKDYKVGDERVADETAVKHLIGKCLSTEKPEAKEDPDGDASKGDAEKKTSKAATANKTKADTAINNKGE